ncbi:hypothetical protein [Halocatena salina]|uniref:DUF7968 domain-containing protein n=1 Tax=Halocatena salina TaxID=2934340 RepID=A0A8U0A829_9EURY|nr:hypothetical protein [Halocatena salina]UPM44658.1 hypothetical protein MW046_16600 [Halocatena salina]
MANSQERSSTGDADRITVTYPATASGHIRSPLETDSYRRYLRMSKTGTTSVGEEWEEFVSGGCGSTTDVVLRVAAIEGGDCIGEETKIVFTPRPEMGE